MKGLSGTFSERQNRFLKNGVFFFTTIHASLVTRKPDFAYAKTKVQISFAVTAKLISAFVFATWIVQFLFFINPNFQASSLFLQMNRPVCVESGQKPRRPVSSRHGS